MKNRLQDEILDLIDAHIIPMWKAQSQEAFSQTDWNECALYRYSKAEKLKNEEAVIELRKQMKSGQLSFDSFLENEQILYLKKYMGKDLFEKYMYNMCMFLKSSRAFDERLNMSQIWQALRNYLIYGMICAMTNQEQCFHKSIMAYSLLYPYTDNFIDNPDISRPEKERFNKMIYKYLTGETTEADDYVSEKTLRCLELCLGYREGTQKDETSELLRIMLDAQELSTTFAGGDMHEYASHFEDLFKSLSYKGGVSVLIDYFFTTEEIEQQEIVFFLKFGLILQLADDIQDIFDDRNICAPTYYSTDLEKSDRDTRLFELQHFVKTVFTDYTAANEQIKEFMLRNAQIMLMFAVVRSREFFSDQLLEDIQPFFPFSYEFMEQLQSELAASRKNDKNQEKMLKAMDEFVERVTKKS